MPIQLNGGAIAIKFQTETASPWVTAICWPSGLQAMACPRDKGCSSVICRFVESKKYQRSLSTIAICSLPGKRHNAVCWDFEGKRNDCVPVRGSQAKPPLRSTPAKSCLPSELQATVVTFS